MKVCDAFNTHTTMSNRLIVIGHGVLVPSFVYLDTFNLLDRCRITFGLNVAEAK